MSLYAIGDLHGCPEELDVLLAHIGTTASDTLVFLGDYVDRGPAVRPLVDRLIRLRDAGPSTVFLRGNHEDMFLSYLELGGRYGEVYLANGGGPTLASYDIRGGVVGSEAAAMVPSQHLRFLLELRYTYVDGPWLFVHAGVRPRVALERQSEEDLLWIRDDAFGRGHDLPYAVVFGHTPRREALIELPDRVGLDTGLVYGNKLSCLDVGGRRLLQVARGGRRVVERDLSAEFSAANL